MARRRSARRPRYFKNPPQSKSSGMSDGAKIALAVVGVAVVGGIGYYFYNQSQNAATASGGGGGGSISSGNQPYQLGSSTSSSMPAAGMSSDGTTISGSVATGPSAATAPPVTTSYEAG